MKNYFQSTKKCSVRPWRVSTTGIVKNDQQSKLNRLLIKLTHYCQQIWGENQENWTKTSPGDNGGALRQPSYRYHLCRCLLGCWDVQCDASWYNYTVNGNWIYIRKWSISTFLFPVFSMFHFLSVFCVVALQFSTCIKIASLFLILWIALHIQSRGQPMLKQQKMEMGKFQKCSPGNINLEMGSKGLLKVYLVFKSGLIFFL